MVPQTQGPNPAAVKQVASDLSQADRSLQVLLRQSPGDPDLRRISGLLNQARQAFGKYLTT